MLKKWLRDALAASGRTQKALAEHLGVEPTAVSKMIAGVRQIKAEELVRIIKFLGVDAPMGSLHSVPMLDVVITGVVAAGVWRDMRGQGMQQSEGVAVPKVPHPKYKGMMQRAVRVDGSDFARTVKPGQYAIYVPLADFRRKPQVGDVVYVTRTRGDLVEHSLRCIHLGAHENVMELRSDPLEGSPEVLLYPSNSRDKIEIIGVCIGIYAPL